MMGHDAIKLELIEWLTKLDDDETIEYLKLVKDSASSEEDWWHNLTPGQIIGIEQGLRDIDEGRVTTHEEVKEKILTLNFFRQKKPLGTLKIFSTI